jgi:DNA-binding Xre family transcriptional regulator
MLYKHIHIGERIRDRVVEQEIPVERICNFLNCCEEDLVEQMY